MVGWFIGRDVAGIVCHPKIYIQNLGDYIIIECA